MSQTQPEIVASRTREAILAARNALKLMRFAVVQSQVAGASLSDMQAGDVIQNQSGYIGATDITAGELRAMLSIFNQLLAEWDPEEVQTLQAKFIGAINLEGQ